MDRAFKVVVRQCLTGITWEIEYIGPETNTSEIAAQLQLMQVDMSKCFGQPIKKEVKYYDEDGNIIEVRTSDTKARKTTPRYYKGYGR